MGDEDFMPAKEAGIERDSTGTHEHDCQGRDQTEATEEQPTGNGAAGDVATTA